MPDTADQSAELPVSERTALVFHIIDRTERVVSQLIKFGTLAICVASIANALTAFAGEATKANIVVQYLTGSSTGLTISISITGNIVLGMLVYKERRLRRRNIERLATQKNELENQLDPRRSSSGLTSDGRTNPRDR